MRSKYEIKAQKELEAEGWTVDYKPRNRFAFSRVDFFNLFDLLAAKRNDVLRFISIKGHAGAPSAHVKAVAEFWLPTSCTKEIWIWPNNKKKKQWIKKVIY